MQNCQSFFHAHSRKYAFWIYDCERSCCFSIPSPKILFPRPDRVSPMRCKVKEKSIFLFCLLTREKERKRHLCNICCASRGKATTHLKRIKEGIKNLLLISSCEKQKYRAKERKDRRNLIFYSRS